MSDLASVEVSVSPVDKFREFLSIRGQRLTQERSIFCEDVFSQHEHFDTEQIVRRIGDQKRSVSRATVYRIVALLEEAGLIRKVARHNDRDVYEHDYGYPQHDHLICTECGEMIEFENKIIAKVLEEVAAKHDFRLNTHRLEAHGMCSDCCRPAPKRNPKLDLL